MVIMITRLLKNQPLFGFCRNISFFGRKKDEARISNTDDVTTEKSSVQEVEVPKRIITKRTLEFLSPYIPPRQVWVENLDTIDTERLGIIDVHPDVFGVNPRIDVIHHNVQWQKMYKYINWTCTKAKHELGRTSGKPWPQKGTGRSRQGHKRNPHWKGGAKTHGPRGPETYFYMLPKPARVFGLCTTLSVKLVQDDLHVVRDLNIPTSDPDYILNLVDSRKWGPSVLFIDVCDTMPRNITFATNTSKHLNLMPVYGLNVYSMLKHSTLVLTLDAVDDLEDKLIKHIHGVIPHTPKYDPDEIKVI